MITGVIDEDVQNKEVISDFSEYELSNGMIIQIRTVVSQIKKTKYFSQDGEPVYTVTVAPVIKFKQNK